MKFGLLIIIANMFFLCSAKSQTIERKEKGEIIDLDNAIIKTGDSFSYSSMFKSIKTIILETNELCLIGFITKMRVLDPYIIILDLSIAKSLYVFDMNGHFIRKIGRIGQGPGDYVQLTDFTVDKDNNIIYVLDSYINRINKYDLNTGKFIHSINLGNNVQSHNIEYVGGIIFADAYFRQHSDDNYLIRTIQDPSGKIDGHFLNVNEYRKGISNISHTFGNAFYLLENGNAVFVQPFMDKIIEVSKDSIVSCFEIKSKDVITSDMVKKSIEKDSNRLELELMQYNKYFQIRNYIEHGNRIQFLYQKGNRMNMIIYDKQTFEVRVFQTNRDDVLFLNRNLDGVPVPSMGGIDVHGVYYYYTTSQISKLRECANKDILSPTLDKLEELKNLDEEANPIIFYYEYKD